MGVLKIYFKAIKWKLRTLLKVTFAIWDDSMVKALQIKKNSEKFDEDPQDDDPHHVDTASLLGTSHSLLWQFTATTVVISKLSEALHKFPVIWKLTKEDLILSPLLISRDTLQVMKGMVNCLSRLGLFIKSLFTEGQLIPFILEMVRFIVTIGVSLAPSVKWFIGYSIIIFPARLLDSLEMYEELGLDFEFISETFDSLSFLLIPLVPIFEAVNGCVNYLLGFKLPEVITEDISKSFKELGTMVEDVGKSTIETTQELVERGKDYLEDAGDTIEEVIEEGKERIQDVFEEGKDTVSDNVPSEPLPPIPPNSNETTI